MIRKVTDTMVGILVVIEEVRSGDWGIAGDCLATEAVHQQGRGAAVPA